MRHWRSRYFPGFLDLPGPGYWMGAYDGRFLGEGTECRFGKGSGQEEWGIGMDRKRRNCASIEMNHGWDISNTNFPFIKAGDGNVANLED